MIRVLYVEDEPHLAKIVAESLSTRNFEVIHIDDGQDALDAYLKHLPDICILDVMLPHIDGFQIGKSIREIDPSSPIIYLTAKSQTSDVIKGFAHGGNDYIRKPFSMEELIVRINNLLHLSSIQAKDTNPVVTTIKIGKFLFYPERQELHLEDQCRRLSHREAQLLLLLMDKQKEAITRKDILLTLWGDDSFFNSRNLDVYVTRLRDYLKQDPDVQIITLKGVGYRVVF